MNKTLSYSIVLIAFYSYSALGKEIQGISSIHRDNIHLDFLQTGRIQSPN